jgi:hypothetical protein
MQQPSRLGWLESALLSFETRLCRSPVVARGYAGSENKVRRSLKAKPGSGQALVRRVYIFIAKLCLHHAHPEELYPELAEGSKDRSGQK